MTLNFPNHTLILWGISHIHTIHFGTTPEKREKKLKALNQITKSPKNLFVAKSLTHSFQLILQVMIMDDGEPQLSSTTRVVIVVEDVNDNAPEFDQKTYNVEVPSNAKLNQKLFQVSGGCQIKKENLDTFRLLFIQVCAFKIIKFPLH